MDRYRRVTPYLQLLLYKPLVLHSSTSFALMINTVSARKFTSSPQSRSTNFDTLKVVQRLEAEGFTQEQSKAVMELLKDVIDESILSLTRTMVTREEQDKVLSLSPLNLYTSRSLLHCGVQVADGYRQYINKK